MTCFVQYVDFLLSKVNSSITLCLPLSGSQEAAGKHSAVPVISKNKIALGSTDRSLFSGQTESKCTEAYAILCRFTRKKEKPLRLTLGSGVQFVAIL